MQREVVSLGGDASKIARSFIDCNLSMPQTGNVTAWKGCQCTLLNSSSKHGNAPRLDELHQALDRAVCDAYGWEYEVLEDEEEILRRLLALNLERAEGQEA